MEVREVGFRPGAPPRLSDRCGDGPRREEPGVPTRRPGCPLGTTTSLSGRRVRDPETGSPGSWRRTTGSLSFDSVLPKSPLGSASLGSVLGCRPGPRGDGPRPESPRVPGESPGGGYATKYVKDGRGRGRRRGPVEREESNWGLDGHGPRGVSAYLPGRVSRGPVGRRGQGGERGGGGRRGSRAGSEGDTGGCHSVVPRLSVREGPGGSGGSWTPEESDLVHAPRVRGRHRDLFPVRGRVVPPVGRSGSSTS